MASLGNDLAEIRKERNLSLDEINKATKIPKRILISIEDDSIFSDFEENPTYIRSYVRTYAKALSIDDDDIIFALNNKQQSDYKGSLRESSETKSKESFRFDDGQEDSDSKDESDESHQMHHDHSPEFAPTGSEQKSSEPSEISSQPQSPRVNSVDWANLGRQFQPLKYSKSRVWIGVLAIAFIAAMGSYLYFFHFSGDTETPQQLAQNTESSNAEITSDSLQLNFTPAAKEDSIQVTDSASATESNESLEALPDTIDVLLYAAYGKLEPVRVSTDIMGNFNPYWLEQGDAIWFDFVNEMRIRENTDNFVLLLNGHPVQNLREQFYDPDTRLFEINRSFFEEDPKWLQPAPDSLAIDAPPPSNIRNRPTFN